MTAISQQTLDRLAEVAQELRRERDAYKALSDAAVAVLRKHAPPDGISGHEALNQLYGIFDGPQYRAAQKLSADKRGSHE